MDLNSISIIGCGWLGYPLAKALKAKDWSVRGTATTEGKVEVLRESGIEAYPFKATKAGWTMPNEALSSSTIVLNLPPGRRGGKQPFDFIALHQEIFILLKSREVEHLVFISSTGDYENTGQKTDEMATILPSNDSAEVLFRAEELLRSSQIPHTILRLSGLVGGERQPGRWFAGKRNIKGGDTPVNMVHRDDCIQAIVQCLENEPTNKTYNICADDHPIKSVFYDRQSRKLGLEVPQFDTGKMPFKVIDNSLFKEQFDFTYKYPDPLYF